MHLLQLSFPTLERQFLSFSTAAIAKPICSLRHLYIVPSLPVGNCLFPWLLFSSMQLIPSVIHLIFPFNLLTAPGTAVPLQYTPTPDFLVQGSKGQMFFYEVEG
ncbi:hypothetical protein AMECASPLE_035910 [Ameca splendens]|uniref:Uncharacterized protein n=1 Tax=Ameca splendens TaxID=208324 RepID=A0ABV0YJ74_9TELE